MAISRRVRNCTLMMLLILVHQTTFCQENFVRGFVVSLQGDTLKGFINYKDWEKNPDAITFKNLNLEVRKRIKPSDIQAFSVGEVQYKSAIVQIEMSDINLNELTKNMELVFKTDTVFLETVIEGKKSLYVFKNGSVRPQFYVKDNNAYQLLIYKKYMAEIEGRNSVKENRTYLHQLLVYLDEMNYIQTKMEKIEYSIYSLRALFLQYYKESKNELVGARKVEKIKVKVGVLAGLSFNSIKFSSYNSPEFTNGIFSKTTSPTAGIFVEFIFPKNQRRWSIENEIVYSSFKTEGKSIADYIDEDKFNSYEIKLDYAYLKLINMLRYKIFIGKINIFANAGITTAFAIKDDKSIQKRTKTYVFDFIKADDTYKVNRKFEQGIIAGLGAKYKNSTFEIRNERSGGMSDLLTLATNINRYNFLVSYQF